METISLNNEPRRVTIESRLEALNLTDEQKSTLIETTRQNSLTFLI